jgi:outer membrane protein OmpA-like peptidoglycan-associated protein
MLNLASAVTEKDPRAKMVVIHQLSWSAGGDALVVKGGVTKPGDLKGKTVALQAYGPHIDYLGKVLEDAGLSLGDIKIKWVKDLSGTGESPTAAFKTAGVDAAVVIIPDALALTSNGAVGTGSEESVKGATILLSTKSANKIIADVYAVRADFYDQNKETVKKFVFALIQAETALANLWKQKSSAEYKNLLTQSAQILLDSPQATKDVEGMYGDAEMVSAASNDQFFNDTKYPRSFGAVNAEIVTALKAAKLIDQATVLKSAQWDYKAMGVVTNAASVSKPKFDTDQVAKAVMRKDQQGTLNESSLFSFDVLFKPNQNSFSPDGYEKDFKKVVNLASTYGGAIITVEGHSDPMAYLKQQKDGTPEVALNRIKQSAKNLSLTRATAVRDALIKYAESNSIVLDPSQFAIVGHGISKPKTGYCGNDPCQPKNEKEWLSNMRVEFRIVQMEAEESVFKPL